MNPYRERVGLREPGMFFGRKSELNEVALFLDKKQSVSIVGPRKIGKTSMLLHLKRPQTRAALNLGAESLLAYMDCQALSLSDSPRNQIYARICTKLLEEMQAQRLPREAALGTVISKPTWLGFEVAIRRLVQRGLRVVLMLDEFEQLAANPNVDVSFFSALRSLADGEKLSFITASAGRLIDLTYKDPPQTMLTSPFFNVFSTQYLGPFSEADARALIRKPMQAGGITVSARLEKFIYRLVGGHPLGLQIACYHAWSKPNNLQFIERRTMEDLDQHFEYYWNHLSAVERNVLREPAVAGVRAANDPGVREVLRDLTLKCLLVHSLPEKYVYPSKAWAEFVSTRSHETLTNSSVEKHNQSQPAPPMEIESPIKRVLGQSLPEMIGGLGVALVTGFVWLIYTMLTECYPEPAPGKCLGIVGLAYNLFDKPVTVWTTLGALSVAFIAILLISGMKRRMLIKKSEK